MTGVLCKKYEDIRILALSPRRTFSSLPLHVHPSNKEHTNDEGTHARQGVCKSESTIDPAAMTRARQLISHALVSVGRGQYGRVDRHSVVQFRHCCGRECCRRPLVRLHKCLVREEDDRGARRGNFDIADVVGATDGLDVNISNWPTV
jgi:hypothetical protein